MTVDTFGFFSPRSMLRNYMLTYLIMMKIQSMNTLIVYVLEM